MGWLCDGHFNEGAHSLSWSGCVDTSGQTSQSKELTLFAQTTLNVRRKWNGMELASSSGLVSLPWHRTPGIATSCFTSHGGWPRNQMSNPHVQSRCLIQMSNPCYCALPLRAACSPDPLVPVAAAPPVLKPQAGTFPVPKDHAKAPSFF